MKHTAFHYCGTTFLGDAEIETIIGTPHSQAYFCATCGEIWYRIVVPGSLWMCTTVPCEKHRGCLVLDHDAIPGSVLYTVAVGSPSYAAHIDFAPAEVIRREFLVHLNHAEKELANESEDAVTSPAGAGSNS